MVRLARAALQTAFVLSEELGTGLAERLFTSPRRHPRPARERAILASGRRRTIEVRLRAPRWAGARTSVETWTWGLGPTVLLVHGWEGRGSQLGALVEPLVAAGLTVVTFDAPGHGDSPGSRLYLTDHADVIADLAETFGPLHAIVAHSFGGAATLLAHARSGVDASRNVLIAPNVLIGDALDRFAQTVGLDPVERTLLEHQISTNTGVEVAALDVERLSRDRDAGLLVIHDPDDREVPLRHGEALAAAWPNAELWTPTGVGHRRILRDPAVVRAVVDAVRTGVPRPTSDLVREVDRHLDAIGSATETVSR